MSGSQRKVPLRLRQRALIYVSATIVVLFAAVYFASSKLLLRSYLDLERREAALNAQRAYEGVTALNSSMSEAASDWGSWDDTYRFMGDKNSKFIADNLSSVVLKLDSITFIDANGRVHYSRLV